MIPRAIAKLMPNHTYQWETEFWYRRGEMQESQKLREESSQENICGLLKAVDKGKLGPPQNFCDILKLLQCNHVRGNRNVNIEVYCADTARGIIKGGF